MSDKTFSKIDFGEDFIWGVSTSALQTEGAHDIDGKGLSIWDVFVTKPRKILNNDTHFEAADFYNNYKTDIALLKQMGISNYRFSLSWPRILPNGIETVNQKGFLS
jgi:beta-glucosidase